MAEFDAIRRIAARLASAPAGELWIGDDAAVVRIDGHAVVASTDALAEGVHFDLSLTTIADAGWKALAVNASDLAAMGCVPSHALITVAGPPSTDVDGLYEGIAAASEAFSCPVVGGDLISAPSLVLTVCVLGNGTVTPPPVTRHSARVGDQVWVTGPLGRAAAGLRDLLSGRHGDESARAAQARPWPRIAEGVAAREAGATAMIDLSDGFASDISHILDGSGVGVILDALPIAPSATDDEALTGGEDYELAFCAPTDAPIESLFASRGLRAPILVGHTVADGTVRTVDGVPLPRTGWVHPIG